MDVYYKEKLHVNHFWEFKGQNCDQHCECNNLLVDLCISY